MLLPFILYCVSFLTIWFGAGLIISTVDVLSKKTRTSRFLLSFFLLGILTSIPEIAVGLTSVIEQRPAVFVGNLLGGVPVLFLFVTPILAILGNGLKIDHTFYKWKLITGLGVILSPSVFVLDGTVSNIEAIVTIVLYLALCYMLKNQTAKDQLNKRISTAKIHVPISILKIIIGIILVFISSHFIVQQTLVIAQLLQVSPFYMSLIGVSLGTNIPELSIAIRSILQKKKDIAFGDYMGSAAANTLLFGIFSLLISGKMYHVQDYSVPFLILVIGLFFFYVFTQSKQTISRKEGILLLSIFVAFTYLSTK